MSLAELLVALAVTGLLLGGAAAIFDVGQGAYVFGVARVEAQQSSRVALERLAAELRQAGFGVEGPAISVAEPTRVVLHLDRDGDGRAEARNETITWLLRGDVLRRSAGAGAQPVVEGVRALSFTYLDTGGAPAATPVEIRLVLVSLTTAARHRAAPGVRFSTAARLRNR